MTRRRGRSSPRRELPARRPEPGGPTGEDAQAWNDGGAICTEVRQSCTEQALKGPHAPPGVAFDMRTTDTEQREAERWDRTGKGLVHAAVDGRRHYSDTHTADKHRSRRQECQRGQDLPIAFHRPPERLEPPYHPTQREDDVGRGEREKQDKHVKHAVDNHGDGTSTETET